MDFQKNKEYMAEQEENILESTQRREAAVRKKDKTERMRNRLRSVVWPVSILTAGTQFDFRILAANQVEV